MKKCIMKKFYFLISYVKKTPKIFTLQSDLYGHDFTQYLNGYG